MKIGDVLKEADLPPDVLAYAGIQPGRWAPVKVALNKLGVGEWLTVVCDSTEELIRLRNSVAPGKHGKFQAVKRGLTLYLTRKKPETNER